MQPDQHPTVRQVLRGGPLDGEPVGTFTMFAGWTPPRLITKIYQPGPRSRSSVEVYAYHGPAAPTVDDSTWHYDHRASFPLDQAVVWPDVQPVP